MSERDAVYDERKRCAAVCRAQRAAYKAQAREAAPQLSWAYLVAANALAEAESLIWMGTEGTTDGRQAPE